MQAALWVFGSAPDKIQAMGTKNEHGMPMDVAINMQFPENAFAQLLIGSEFGGKCNELIVNGTKGYIRVKHPFHAPTEMDVNGSNVTYELPMSDGKYFFNHSVGLAYEAQRVADCIREGRIECPEMTHETSVLLAQLIEEVHKQLGVTFHESHSLLDSIKHKILSSE